MTLDLRGEARAVASVWMKAAGARGCSQVYGPALGFHKGCHDALGLELDRE